MNASFYFVQIIAAVLVLILGLFVYLKDLKTRINKLFFLVCFAIFNWLLMYGLAYLQPEEILALYFFKIGYTSVLFIPVILHSFISAYLKRTTDKYFIAAGYVVVCVFAVTMWGTNIFLDGLYTYDWGRYPKAGPLHPLYLVFYGIYASRIVFLLCKEYFTSHKDLIIQNQLKYILLAWIIVIPAFADFIANYGFGLRPISFSFMLFFVGIISYAIFRHQLLDIDVIIKRTAVFAGLFTFVYGIFTVFSVLSQRYLEAALGWNQWIAMIPTVFVITFSLRPLETFLTNATEKFLFQKKYDYRVLLKIFTDEILTVLDLKKLTEQTAQGLHNIIKLESASVLLFDKDAKLYKLAASMGVKQKDLAFKENDILISYLKASNKPLLKDKNADKIGSEGDLFNAFKSLNSQLCLPLEIHDELIGVLSVGMKKSGEDYTQEDIDILMTLARTAAIAISNARLFRELSVTQAEAAQREKMAVIGTLAAGINHEICNPLGIVRGQCEMFLLNLRDGFYDKKTPDELLVMYKEIMNKVIKETDRATGITKKLSSFAKPANPSDLKEVYVDKELDEVISLIEHDMKLNNIEIQKDFPGNFPLILADKKQIEEVLFNIIRNAAQAIESDKRRGKIVISGFTENGSAVVRIADNGTGIPPERIEQIFHPFYTTKAPGKGTGLGLFITKQVVERNRGTIQVESEAGIGTTFTLKFPTAAALAAH